jgi:6-phosphofructokinase 1
MPLKGNLIVGQSGGPTAVINSSLVGVIEEAGKHSEIEGIYGCVHGVQGLLKEDIVDLGKESPQTIQALKTTPSAALGSCRYKLKDQDLEKILRTLQDYNIRYFLYIGGNDSAETCHAIEQLAREQGYELKTMGVPKTIDNDLEYTDHCPGYGSVARFIATATMDAGKDTEAIGVVDNVKIIETMGRNAGWITAATALARREERDAPHLVYLPEIPFNQDRFLSDVQNVFDRFGHCVLAICEGLRGPGGKELVASKRSVDTDAFGHKQLGGVGDFLCDLIATNLKIKARFDKPGTIQRMSSILASPVDLEEAYMVGQAAVEAIIEGPGGQMVTLVRESNQPYRCTTGLAPLAKVAQAERKVPPEFINREGNFVTEAFLHYLRPLVGSLPQYARLEMHRVAKLVS